MSTAVCSTRATIGKQMRELVGQWNELPPEEEEIVRISGPGDVIPILQAQMYGLEQEELKVILLNRKNHVLKIVDLYRGSLHTSVVRVSEIFRDAVRVNAASILLAHNHPTGDPTPSPEDVRVTRDAVQAGKLLDIEVLDHLVIGRGLHVSMREQRLGFER